MARKELITLKKAVATRKIEQFIGEHEKDAPGDTEKLDKVLKRPASQKSKEVPKASTRRGSDD